MHNNSTNMITCKQVRKRMKPKFKAAALAALWCTRANATKIQRIARGYIARRQYEGILVAHLLREQVALRA